MTHCWKRNKMIVSYSEQLACLNDSFFSRENNRFIGKIKSTCDYPEWDDHAENMMLKQLCLAGTEISFRSRMFSKVKYKMRLRGRTFLKWLLLSKMSVLSTWSCILFHSTLFAKFEKFEGSSRIAWLKIGIVLLWLNMQFSWTSIENLNKRVMMLYIYMKNEFCLKMRQNFTSASL